ncbi:MAG: type II toxin-antitoxin system VapC family toxin [Geminicoccaceae bacterium]
MLLVDTSVWIDHLRRSDDALAEALHNDMVIMHPHVLGELALGNLQDRSAVLSLLRNLSEAVVATDDEVQSMIEEQSLFGRGIGYTDAHLLASVRLTAEAKLWTRDKRLITVAEDLGVGCG